MKSSKLHRLLQLHGLLLCPLILSSIYHSPVAGVDSHDFDVSVEADVDDDVSLVDGTKVFLPSHEWQTLHPDETVFAGLHYRINMATGLKEAKLMDGDDGSQYYRLLNLWVQDKQAGTTGNGGFKVTKQIKLPRKSVIEKNSSNNQAAGDSVNLHDGGYGAHGLAVVPNEEVKDHFGRKFGRQHRREVLESVHSSQQRQHQSVERQQEAHGPQQNAHMQHQQDSSFFEDLRNIDDSHRHINDDEDFDPFIRNENEIKQVKTSFTTDNEKSTSSSMHKKENVSTSNSDAIYEADDTASNSASVSSTLDTKAKFRSYEELKNDLAELELLIDDEQNVVRNLIQKHRRLADSDQLISNLEDLEYLLHNIDNAQVFLDEGGLLSVVLRSLSDPTPAIRWLACRLVTACVQNNPLAQIAAYEAGLLDTLVALLRRNHQDKQVAESALSALSTVVSNFPAGQMALLERAGPLFRDVLRNGLHTGKRGLQRKTILLLADLLLERSEQDNLKGVQEQQRRDQLAAVNLEANLMTWDWCHYLTRNLQQLEYEYNKPSTGHQQQTHQSRSHDEQLQQQEDHHPTNDLEATIDAVMYGMSASADLCSLELRSCESAMQRLHARFRSLAAAQSDYYLAEFYLQKANDVHGLGTELQLTTFSASGRPAPSKEEL